MHLSKYPVCVPNLTGNVGFSAKMSEDRAVISAETSMPLAGAKLPETCRLEESRSSVWLPFPSAHLSLGSVSESIALLGRYLLRENF